MLCEGREVSAKQSESESEQWGKVVSASARVSDRRSRRAVNANESGYGRGRHHWCDYDHGPRNGEWVGVRGHDCDRGHVHESESENGRPG